MNPRAELETIRERIERLDDINRADISFQMSAHYALDTILSDDLPRLLDAVEKVLERHQSDGDESNPECITCRDPHNSHWGAPWPCAEYTTIIDVWEGK